MQKWGVVFVVLLLLSSVAFAVPTGVPSPNEDIEGVTRITKFETDNVHILRLGNFSRAVVNEVSNLQQNISLIQQQLAVIQEQLEELKQAKNVPVVDNSGINRISAAVVGIESEIQQLKSGSNNNNIQWQLVLNAVILLGIFALFLFIRVNGPFDSRRQAELHARLHLGNAVRNALKTGVPVEQVRQRFVSQGWNSLWVDRAIEDGVKR